MRPGASSEPELLDVPLAPSPTLDTPHQEQSSAMAAAQIPPQTLTPSPPPTFDTPSQQQLSNMATAQAPAQALAPSPPPPSQTSTPPNLKTLPPAIIRDILKNLEPSSLIAISQSCRKLCRLYFVNNKILWRTMAFAHPKATIKKYFKYVTWLVDTLSTADAGARHIVLNIMTAPLFHTRTTAALSPEEEKQTLQIFEADLNGHAIFNKILRYDRHETTLPKLIALSLQLSDDEGDISSYSYPKRTVVGPRYIEREPKMRGR